MWLQKVANWRALMVEEMLQHMNLETASIAAGNGYDSFHVASKQGHLGKLPMILHFLVDIPVNIIFNA